ncbi:mercuric reductase [Purpureocillium lavendulum]|uniref:Stress-associated endoplasmic reticulum protein n=1 Tax=Purpureocillium lavendulum TaxID=1247861 RepID=A0AB34FJ35_9HYPO|nr:mercuric reductase [Purpureocillium lavendulum]
MVFPDKKLQQHERPALQGPRIAGASRHEPPRTRAKATTTTTTFPPWRAQTLEQRRRNAKFAKVQEAKMGKSDDQLKKRTKETPKAPISMFWIVLLGFIVFGGLVFEALSRMFGQ